MSDILTFLSLKSPNLLDPDLVSSVCVCVCERERERERERQREREIVHVMQLVGS